MKQFLTLLFSSAVTASLALPVVAQSNNTRIFVHTIANSADESLWTQLTDVNDPYGKVAEPGWDFAAGDGHGGPYNCGVQMVVPWSVVESTQGTYDFTQIDQLINNLAGTGSYWKGLDLTFSSVAENTNNELHASSASNCPSGAHYTSSGGTYFCENTPGYVIDNMIAHGDTVFNTNTAFNTSNDPDTNDDCSVTTSGKGLPETPNYQSSIFTNRWEAFIVAVLKHFKNNPTVNAHLAALHFSIGAGEAAPIADPSQNCIKDLEGGYGTVYPQSINLSNWTTWAKGLIDYVNSEVSTVGNGNQVQIYWDLNDMGAFAKYENTTDNFMSAVAAEANGYGMGIGNDGFGFSWEPDGVNNTSHTWLFEAAGTNTTSGFTGAGTLNAALTYNSGAGLWYAETASPGCQTDPPMTSPAAPTFPSTGSGSLPAGTYYYEVDAINQYGEETAPTAATEASFTLTSTGSVKVKWQTQKLATGYRIYRGTTSGGENTYYYVSGQSTSTYTDTGSAGTSGTPPTSYIACLNTSHGLFDQVLNLTTDPSSYTASFPSGYSWPVSSPLGTNKIRALQAYPQEWDIAYDSNTTNNPLWGVTDPYASSGTYNTVYQNAFSSAGFSTSSCQVPFGQP